jgi:hypothetical protein
MRLVLTCWFLISKLQKPFFADPETSISLRVGNYEGGGVFEVARGKRVLEECRFDHRIVGLVLSLDDLTQA